MGIHPPSPEPTVWPRSAQIAAAFLAGVAVALLGVRLIESSAWRARPLMVERGAIPEYRIDLNAADRSSLVQLPGVGPKLADRILAARDQRGGFDDLTDLAEVPGIGPMTLTRLQPHVTPTTGPPPQVTPRVSGKKEPPPRASIDVNRATEAELQRLPGIGPTLAGRIVAERQQRLFVSVDDLRRVKGIGPKTLEAIRPFIVLELAAEVRR